MSVPPGQRRRQRAGDPRALLALLSLLAAAALLVGACAPIGDRSVVAGPGGDDDPTASLAQDAAGLAGERGEAPPDEDGGGAAEDEERVPPELPRPEPLPVDAYEPTPEVQVGQIAIPRIGIDETLHEGMTLTAINRGPSMWPGTALPGEVGNLVVAGHRTTYGGPFRNLDDLEPDDEIVFTTDEGTFTYAVTETEIVDPSRVDIASQTNHFTATLFACHPPGSAAQRIVVRAQLLRGNGQPMPPL